MDNIVLISAPEVLKFPTLDNNEGTVSLLGYPKIVIDRRKQMTNEQYVVRKTVLIKLLDALQYLPPPEINFLVVESFRPLSIQTRYFKEYSEELKKLHPEWDAAKIYSEASKYVSPPEIIPPHSTGGAIDLTLCDEQGKELDMGTRLNADPGESDNACFTAAENISDEAKTNRKILIDALSNVGFINYPTEWWHWSYGDRYWAFNARAPYAIYGSVSE
jgi:D-alanyl-D-alanine dipeptidase